MVAWGSRYGWGRTTGDACKKLQEFQDALTLRMSTKLCKVGKALEEMCSLCFAESWLWSKNSTSVLLVARAFFAFILASVQLSSAWTRCTTDFIIMSCAINFCPGTLGLGSRDIRLTKDSFTLTCNHWQLEREGLQELEFTVGDVKTPGKTSSHCWLERIQWVQRRCIGCAHGCAWRML